MVCVAGGSIGVCEPICEQNITQMVGKKRARAHPHAPQTAKLTRVSSNLLFIFFSMHCCSLGFVSLTKKPLSCVVRPLTPVNIAAARIFGTRIGNYAHKKSGNKVFRQKLRGRLVTLLLAVRVVVRRVCWPCAGAQQSALSHSCRCAM